MIASLAELSEHIIRFNQFDRDGFAGLGHLAVGPLSWLVVADGGGGDDSVAVRKCRQAGVAHIGSGDDLADVASGRRLQIDRASDEHDFMPGIECGLRQCIAHAPAAGVRQVTHIVNVFAGRSGGEEDSHVRMMAFTPR